jgi:2Fe-2S ferredoxin
VIVKEGEANLTDMDEDEEDRIYMADSLTLHSRLGCQAIVKGDVTVEIVE